MVWQHILTRPPQNFDTNMMKVRAEKTRVVLPVWLHILSDFWSNFKIHQKLLAHPGQVTSFVAPVVLTGIATSVTKYSVRWAIWRFKLIFRLIQFPSFLERKKTNCFPCKKIKHFSGPKSVDRRPVPSGLNTVVAPFQLPTDSPFEELFLLTCYWFSRVWM